MNNEPSTNTGFKNGGAVVIKPWLSGGLVVALVALLAFGAILVIMLSRFDDAKRQAQEAEAGFAKVPTELSSLQGEIDSLTKHVSITQTRFEKIQQEEGGLRQARAKWNTELAALRQQIQTHKDQLPTFDQTAADFKVLQTAAQQTEQKSANSQEHLAIMKARSTEMESRQRQAASERVQLTNRLGQARSQAVIRILNATPASLQG